MFIESPHSFSLFLSHLKSINYKFFLTLGFLWNQKIEAFFKNSKQLNKKEKKWREFIYSFEK